MKKNCTFGKKALVILLQQLCVLVSAGLLLHMLLSCIITNDTDTYLINPLETEGYTESSNLTDMFTTDAMDLMYYLAVSQQFETKGKFDEGKKIDLLQYFYRKTPNAKRINSAGTLVYRVGDLLQWPSIYVDSNGFVEEQFYPINGGGSVYSELNLVEILDATLPDGIDEFPEDGLEIFLTEETVEEETLEEKVAEEKAEVNLSEEPSKEDIAAQKELLKELEALEKIQKRKEAKARAIFYRLISSASSDLNINYNKYITKKEYYNTEQTNFKYVYIPEKQEDLSKNFYTNLSVNNLKEAKEIKDKFTPTNYNSNNLSCYFIIEPYRKTIVEKSSNMVVSSRWVDQVLDEMSYAFPNAGYIYVGVYGKGNASFVKSDGYASAQTAYTYVTTNFQQYIIAVILAFSSAIVLYVLYLMMCGHRAKYIVIEEEGIKKKQLVLTEGIENLNMIDTWYTEIYLLIGGGMIGGIILLLILGISVFDDSSFIPLLKTPVFFTAVLASVFLLNSLLLFFSGGIVKRLKAKVFVKNSILYKLLMLLWKGFKNACKAIRDGVITVYKRMNQLGKILITYVPFILLNLIVGFSQSFVIIIFMLVGDGVVFFYLFRSDIERTEIVEGISRISQGEFDFKLDETKMHGDNKKLAKAVNKIGEGIKQAVETSMKDERLKADLITNVSHDIKTPLTSIINYVDLLKRENVQDKKLQEYIHVLESKSQRLKQLTDDLVEASKITSGNLILEMEKLNVIELMNQVVGEFSEKFKEHHLDIITRFPENDSIITADGRRMWRVIENLFENIYKYAMVGTRVYVEVYEAMENSQKKVFITIKNISAQPLNIQADELTERFIRGDISRSTEGSGLGLSIAKSLVHALKGQFGIYLDGDLFKVIISFYAEEDMLI